MYSIWSAYTFGVAISTVAGRLWITGRSGEASHSSVRLSQISRMKSGSVRMKTSGENSNRMSESDAAAASRAICVAASRITPCTSARLRPSTTSRQTGAVGM